MKTQTELRLLADERNYITNELRNAKPGSPDCKRLEREFDRCNSDWQEAMVENAPADGVSAQRASAIYGSTVASGPSDEDIRNLLNPEHPSKKVNLLEGRATSYWWNDTSSGSVMAGYTQPTSVLDRIVYHINAESGVFDSAYKFQTSTGEDVTIPVLATDGVAGMHAATVSSTISAPVFASETLKSYRIDGHFALADELIRDSAVDIKRVVGDCAGREIATKLASYLATGTGSGEPEGVTVGAAAGVTCAAATYCTLDEIKSLYYSCAGPVRKNGVFVASSDVTVGIAQAKLDTGEYAWQPAMAAAQPDTLFGRPYYEDSAFPSMASNTVPMVFGDLANYYWVRTVMGGNNGGGIQLDFSQDYAFPSFMTYARYCLFVDARVLGAGGEIRKLTMAA